MNCFKNFFFAFIIQDSNKKAWFPRIDDDFLAIYQMNYGFIDNTTKSETTEKPQAEIVQKTNDAEIQDESTAAATESSGRKRKAPAPPPKWFDVAPEQNTKVYVSNLPNDITEDEFGQLMSKCGLVMKDLKSGKLKLKLYRDSQGELKGDGLCHYIKVSHLLHLLNFNEVTFYNDFLRSEN